MSVYEIHSTEKRLIYFVRRGPIFSGPFFGRISVIGDEIAIGKMRLLLHEDLKAVKSGRFYKTLILNDGSVVYIATILKSSWPDRRPGLDPPH